MIGRHISYFNRITSEEKNDERKLMTIALSITMLASSASLTFATTSINGQQTKQAQVQKEASIVEDIVGTNDVVKT